MVANPPRTPLEAKEAAPPTYDLLQFTLTELCRAFGRTAQSARTTDSGFGSWWELQGYADILHDAITRAARHRRRSEGIERQIARERA